MKATNAGKPINTKFDEIAPYLHVNSRNLYFASNGIPNGFGGFDIYVSEKDIHWQEPKNLGSPLNDFEDQYSFVVTSDGANAFYSREEGRMKSKIYQTDIPKELQIKSRGNVVTGTVRDEQTKNPIGSDVELFDLKTNQRISVFASDSVNGHYLIVIPGKSEYALHVSEPGYLFYSLHFNYEEKDQDQPLVIDIALQPIKKNAVAVLNNIFFESNKFEINSKSFTELNEVVKFLQINSSIKIEISGHTDNVGDENYNQQLSQKRAQSVAEYLLSKGIESSRLTQVGYGSRQPIQPNDSEEHRQANRRIEFKVR
jgi:outer membrane protein OmpA-like peptidoglycan-associated protein